MAFNNLDLTPYYRNKENPIDLAVQRALQVPQYINSLRAAQQGIQKSDIVNKNLPLRLELANQLAQKQVEKAGIENQFLPEEKRLNIKDLRSTIYGRDLDSQKKNLLMQFVQPQAQAELQQAQQTAHAQELANQFSEKKLPYADEIIKGELTKNQVDTAMKKFYVDHPELIYLKNSTGPMKDLLTQAAVEKQYPELTDKIKQKETEVQRKDNSRVFNSLPAANKKAEIATLMGMGAKSQTEALNWLMDGKTAQDWADAKGVDIDSVVKQYAPEAGNIKRSFDQKSSQAGLHYMDSFIKKWGSNPNYGGIWEGKMIQKHPYFTKVVQDAQSQDPKKSMEAKRYLAAQIAQLDATTLRNRVQGMQPGVTIVNETTRAMGSPINTALQYLPANVRGDVISMVDDMIMGSANAEQNAYLASNPDKIKLEGEQENFLPPIEKNGISYVKIVTKDGKKGYIPESDLDSYLKSGAKRAEN